MSTNIKTYLAWIFLGQEQISFPMFNQVTVAKGRHRSGEEVSVFNLLLFSLATFELIQHTACITSSSSLWICHTKNTNIIPASKKQRQKYHCMFEDSLAYIRSSQGRCGCHGRKKRKEKEMGWEGREGVQESICWILGNEHMDENKCWD